MKDARSGEPVVVEEVTITPLESTGVNYRLECQSG